MLLGTCILIYLAGAINTFLYGVRQAPRTDFLSESAGKTILLISLAWWVIMPVVWIWAGITWIQEYLDERE